MKNNAREVFWARILNEPEVFGIGPIACGVLLVMCCGLPTLALLAANWLMSGK